MISRGLKAVLKMHLKQQMLSKAFVWSTLLLPVMMFAIILIQFSLNSLDTVEPSHVYITSENPALLESLETAFGEREEVKSGTYTMEYKQVDESALADYLNSKRETLMADSNNGLFHVPSAAATDKHVRFYSTNLGNQVVREKVTDVLNAVLNRSYFRNSSLAQADIDYAVKAIEIEGLRVSAGGEEEGGIGNFAVGFGMAILLMISMMGIVMPFSAAIIEEKTNRAVEVLLTSVSPRELLAGKILARAITGVSQMVIWLMPLFVVMLDPTILEIPDEYRVDIGFGLILFFVANYVLGLTILLSIWGGFSAMFDSTQDAGNALWPVTILMWMPFYAIFSLFKNPANSVAEILSIAPFTSLYVMPLRMAIVEVPFWQPLLALAISGLLFYGAVVAGGKIYRISVLSTGQQPSMQQFVKWLRQPG
ncbi:MAG: ABC transporter permease [Pseudomonadota bacterium]